VAELLHATGRDDLVQEVAASDNHAWVVDLSRDERFTGWLRDNGLSLWEAARIQVPTIGGGPGGPPDPLGNGTKPAGGTYRGPGDTVPAGGSAPASSGGSSGASRTAGETAGASAAPQPTGTGAPSAPKLPGMPTAMSLTTESDDGWWLWWEYNKLEFLRPNRLDDWMFPATGDGEGLDRTRAVRRELLPVLTQALASPDAQVRGAAALALGRIGRGEAVAKLLAALGDASVQVRHRAILALGSPARRKPSSRCSGSPARARRRRTPRSACRRSRRPMAIVALALGRRIGFDASIDEQVAKIAAARRGAERDAIRNAAFIYQRIAPCAALEALAIETALDSTQAPSVRCRAAEAAASATDDRTLSKLQTLLSGPRLDLRRSAALALGESKHALALPPLMTAFETESETLTKGLPARLDRPPGRRQGARSPAARPPERRDRHAQVGGARPRPVGPPRARRRRNRRQGDPRRPRAGEEPRVRPRLLARFGARAR
jgi:hypothetical protein